MPFSRSITIRLGISAFRIRSGWTPSETPSPLRQSSWRVDRLERGLFGDCEPVGDGVWELRIDTGAGYRVYYGRSKKQAVLLLCGGDKRTPESGHKASQ